MTIQNKELYESYQKLFLTEPLSISKKRNNLIEFVNCFKGIPDKQEQLYYWMFDAIDALSLKYALAPKKYLDGKVFAYPEEYFFDVFFIHFVATIGLDRDIEKLIVALDYLIETLDGYSDKCFYKTFTDEEIEKMFSVKDIGEKIVTLLAGPVHIIRTNNSHEKYNAIDLPYARIIVIPSNKDEPDRFAPNSFVLMLIGKMIAFDMVGDMDGTPKGFGKVFEGVTGTHISKVPTYQVQTLFGEFFSTYALYGTEYMNENSLCRVLTQKRLKLITDYFNEIIEGK